MNEQERRKIIDEEKLRIEVRKGYHNKPILLIFILKILFFILIFLGLLLLSNSTIYFLSGLNKGVLPKIMPACTIISAALALIIQGKILNRFK